MALVIGDAYGHKPLYLAAVDRNNGNRFRAVLPLFRIKRSFCKPEWVSIPFFDHAGILASDQDAGKWLLEQAGIFLGSKGAGRLSLRQDDRFDASGLVLQGSSPGIYDEKIGMQIPLASGRKQMMAHLLDHFYRVFSRNMRDLGPPVHSKQFFRSLFENFPANAFICVVYHWANILHEDPKKNMQVVTVWAKTINSHLNETVHSRPGRIFKGWAAGVRQNRFSTVQITPPIADLKITSQIPVHPDCFFFFILTYQSSWL